MTNRIEIVSEDLARELKPCPHCNQQPTIFKYLRGLPLRPTIAVCCTDCDGYQNGVFREIRAFIEHPWYPTLYEAVSVWNGYAALVGEPAPEVDNGVPF